MMASVQKLKQIEKPMVLLIDQATPNHLKSHVFLSPKPINHAFLLLF